MTPEAFYKRMKAFDSFYYCVFADEHPREILTMDNNLEIAFYLRKGNDIKGLRKSGIEFKRSQLSLLKSYDLISEDDGRMHSNVLFFPEYEAGQLRNIADDVAIRIAAEIAGSLGNLRDVLSDSGFSNNIFSIFFSYILDGLVWDTLIKRGLIRELSIKDKLRWDGVIWFIEPKRGNSIGTYCTRSGKVASCITTGKPSDKSKFGKNLTGVLADEFRKSKSVSDKKLVSCLEKNCLYKDGNLLIPVIRESSDDPIYKEVVTTANMIVDLFAAHMTRFSGLPMPGGSQNWKSTVIIYHEIMWGIMDILVKAGETVVPGLLKNSDGRISDLMYILLKP